MEIGHVVSELWRLRRWVAFGTIVALVAAASVLYDLPSLEKKSFELGAASVDVLVESSGAPLGTLGSPENSERLTNEAVLYARLIGTSPVRERIARKAGVAVERIASSASQSDQGGREVASEQRANELLTEGNTYRIFAGPGPDLPLIAIATQASTAKDAVRVAEATVSGLREYVSDVAELADTPRSVRFRALGTPTGGTITQDASLKVAGLAFVGAFVAWALLVLVAARMRDGWRQTKAAERLGEDLLLETDDPRYSDRDDVTAGRRAPERIVGR